MNPRTGKFLRWFAVGVPVAIIVFVIIHLASSKPASQGADDSPPDSYRLVSPDVIEADDAALKTADVRTTMVESRDLPVTLTLTGRTGLDADNVTHVHAQFGGKVKEVKPELGDVVQGPESTTQPSTHRPAQPATQPTVLCIIESNDLAQAKANYLQAKVQLKLDNDNLDRTKELVKSTVLAEKFLLDAQSAVTKDAALLEAARQQLLVFGLSQIEIDRIETEQGKQRMDYIIASPRSGVVAEKGVSGGEIADPTINLFTIADTSKMWIWGDVYERDLKRIKLGEKARVRFTSDPDRPRECSIDWISPVLDPNTHSIRVRGTIDNRDGRLLADMYGTMIVTVDAGANSLVVPSDAVIRVGTDAFVFAQTGSSDGKTQFRKTPVSIESVDVGFGTTDSAVASATSSGDANADGTPTVLVRIARGLQPGQNIVKSGALGLFNEMNQHAE